MNMADINSFQKVRCIIMACTMLRHLYACDLLMDPKGAKFNTVQAGQGGGGEAVRNMITRRRKG